MHFFQVFFFPFSVSVTLCGCDGAGLPGIMMYSTKYCTAGSVTRIFTLSRMNGTSPSIPLYLGKIEIPGFCILMVSFQVVKYSNILIRSGKIENMISGNRFNENWIRKLILEVLWPPVVLLWCFS